MSPISKVKFNEMQQMNAVLSILLAVFGITIISNEWQDANTRVGPDIFQSFGFRDMQLPNACISITITFDLSFMTTEMNC